MGSDGDLKGWSLVVMVEYLVANFPRLGSGDGSPLYSAAATHTLE